MMRVKICGVTRVTDLREAVIAGASYIGLNFFEKSPRFVDAMVARELALEAPVGVVKVGLFVNADDAFLDGIVEAVPLDMLQLHGGESAARVAEVKARYGLPVMKVIGVSGAEDLAQLEEFEAADQFLLDAKPPKDAILPGGNGVSFDWKILKQHKFDKPWMLAGGLRPDNVAEAVKISGATQVDVASGVESAPGIKDKKMMEDFIQAARG